MKIALPVIDPINIYKDNPHTAPKFAVYNIIQISHHEVYYSLDRIIDNKLSKVRSAEFDNDECKAHCDIERQKNLRHTCDHYSLLEHIGGCSYLLATKYCKNTKKSMNKAGIRVFQIPSIINKANLAIKNFLIGGVIADKIENIHHAS